MDSPSGEYFTALWSTFTSACRRNSGSPSILSASSPSIDTRRDFSSIRTSSSAVLLGAKQVISIDCLPERLSMARAGGAITINFEEESVVERLNDLTGGKGPEKCIDAVGLEAHATATI